MMMECPKCGFQQPEDEFCAQCGVNIESFKNKPLPKAKKLWNKLSVQISLTLVLVTVLSTVWYIKNNQPNKTPEELSAVWEKDITQTSSEAQIQPQENTNNPEEPQPSNYENMEPQEINKTATLSREESVNPQPDAPDPSMEFTSSIIEAPLSLLQGLGQSVYRNTSVTAIEFDPNEDFPAWLQQLQQQDQLIVLQPVEKKDWHNSSFAQFRDQIMINEDAGYSTTITLRPQPDNTAQLEVRTANTRAAQAQSTAPDEGIQTYTIPVKPNKAYVIFGFFPRPETALKMPELQTPNRVLSVLSSPDFIGGASDLALIFVLK